MQCSNLLFACSIALVRMEKHEAHCYPLAWSGQQVRENLGSLSIPTVKTGDAEIQICNVH